VSFMDELHTAYCIFLAVRQCRNIVNQHLADVGVQACGALHVEVVEDHRGTIRCGQDVHLHDLVGAWPPVIDGMLRMHAWDVLHSRPSYPRSCGLCSPEGCEGVLWRLVAARPVGHDQRALSGSPVPGRGQAAR
jgi:hypothetical protein